MAFVSEAEQLHIKPILGDELFLFAVEEAQKNATEQDEKIKLLLSGGRYTFVRNNDTVTKYFEGLKVALAYFAYGQNVMTGDYESTRYGTVVKNGDYSSHLSDKSRSDLYNNITEIANAYMQECVAYCKAVGLIKTAGKSRVSFGGITIRKIG